MFKLLIRGCNTCARALLNKTVYFGKLDESNMLFENTQSSTCLAQILPFDMIGVNRNFTQLFYMSHNIKQSIAFKKAPASEERNNFFHKYFKLIDAHHFMMCDVDTVFLYRSSTRQVVHAESFSPRMLLVNACVFGYVVVCVNSTKIRFRSWQQNKHDSKTYCHADIIFATQIRQPTQIHWNGGNTVVIGNYFGEVYKVQIDFNSGKTVTIWKHAPHVHMITSIYVQQNLTICGSFDRSISIMASDTTKPDLVLHQHVGEIVGVTCIDGLIVTASKTGTVKGFANLKVKHSYETQSPILYMNMYEPEQQIVLSCEDGNVHVLHSATLTMICKIQVRETLLLFACLPSTRGWNHKMYHMKQYKDVTCICRK